MGEVGAAQLGQRSACPAAILHRPHHVELIEQGGEVFLAGLAGLVPQLAQPQSGVAAQLVLPAEHRQSHLHPSEELFLFAHDGALGFAERGKEGGSVGFHGGTGSNTQTRAVHPAQGFDCLNSRHPGKRAG